MNQTPNQAFAIMDLENTQAPVYRSNYCDEGGADPNDQIDQHRRMVSGLVHGAANADEYLRYLENNPDALLMLADDATLRRMLGKLLLYFHYNVLELREGLQQQPEGRARKTAVGFTE